MSKKVRHVLGISGGKDSAALAMYMQMYHPEIDMEYYFSDTGKELPETYELISELESFLGKKILKLEANHSHKNPFDHYLDIYNGFLPSSMARWCTQKLKLEPFERWIGDDLAISYVGIRDDEDREGYVSTKSNIQSVFPFRKHIWSIEVLHKVLHNSNREKVEELYKVRSSEAMLDRFLEVVKEPQSSKYLFSQKLKDLLQLSISSFNHVVFDFLKDQNFPVSHLAEYSLLHNEDSVDINRVFRLFKDNGVKVPGYYDEVEYEVNGQKGKYNRSRSGCFFCFYQRKIEWIWLYERHPELFKAAQEYEKDGYSWMDNETLDDLIQPERMAQIKLDYIATVQKKLNNKNKSNKLVDILANDDEVCANCFI
ncbi:phosphoadenosine phosphosulfate reductase family protein [uncultured Draconibacterium sp.]|uniref:phosphoadenosine phosphosulfate reductase family protein n=1 Tax=uncultured Draconibacterium sp. TaxID=1573823 RepID=UPI0029C8750E|nr:phosphoadenosine phosphosulfate reductase family protein [uncultured Draconibacterium sp.]